MPKDRVVYAEAIRIVSPWVAMRALENLTVSVESHKDASGGVEDRKQ